MHYCNKQRNLGCLRDTFYCHQHGMTPLMNAAYKGKAETCELLLAQGADVNSNYHEHQVNESHLTCQILLKLLTVRVKSCCVATVVVLIANVTIQVKFFRRIHLYIYGLNHESIKVVVVHVSLCQFVPMI